VSTPENDPISDVQNELWSIGQKLAQRFCADPRTGCAT
jgi:hypothetical protein